jgi:hypothetical protein
LRALLARAGALLSSANLDVTRVSLQLALLYVVVEQARAAVQPNVRSGQVDLLDLPGSELDVAASRADVAMPDAGDALR